MCCLPVPTADQLASCANLLGKSVHLWDTRRPYLPVARCAGHNDVTTGLAWIENRAGAASTRFLACSKDSTLAMHDISRAEKPLQSLRTTALSLSPFAVASLHDDVGT